MKELDQSGYGRKEIGGKNRTATRLLSENIKGRRSIFKKKELREILEMAADLEESVKTGRLTDALATELFIVKYSMA